MKRAFSPQPPKHTHWKDSQESGIELPDIKSRIKSPKMLRNKKEIKLSSPEISEETQWQSNLSPQTHLKKNF